LALACLQKVVVEAKGAINKYQNKHISSLVTVVLPPPAPLPLVSGFLLLVLLDPSSTFAFL
jgi:hypothetical protein